MDSALECLRLQNCAAEAIGCQNANLPIASIKFIQTADSQPAINHKTHVIEVTK
jgi:hypothetical protein